VWLAIVGKWKMVEKMLKEIAEEKTNMADTQGKEDVEKDSVSQKNR